MERPKMPLAQSMYGAVIYWITIAAAIICMIGPVIALLNVDNNVVNPHYLFDAIFKGQSAQEVWEAGGGAFPGGHFYISRLNFGDGFTQLGLALGCGVAFPALIAAAIGYIKEKNYGYMLLSLWVAFMVAFSMIGILKGH